MMRLPLFEFRAPRTLEEAARILDGERTNAMPLAGGTDLLPNMKRRQQVPRTLMSLRHIESLSKMELSQSGSRLGACLTLSDIAEDTRFRNGLTALAQAASLVATPQIRNMATLGGNICLDTRCNYYDQSYEWRKAINFCLKKDGTTCWVAPGSSKCMAVSSTDTGPALMALGARVRLVSRSGEREVLLSDLYNNDGIDYIKRRPDEILAEILLDSLHGWKSTYWKLSCRPLAAQEAAKSLLGRTLDQRAIEDATALAARIAKPLDNTDFDMTWRKRVTAEFVTYALRELRGDDMRAERESFTRYTFQ